MYAEMAGDDDESDHQALAEEKAQELAGEIAQPTFFEPSNKQGQGKKQPEKEFNELGEK